MLIGRATEWAAVEALLTRAGEAGGGVLLVRGEAGAGKSALLEEAAGRPGFRVLRATGVEAESELPYATAHQLLLPLLPALDAIPGVQAGAVRVALGMGDGGTPDRFLVALGFLSLVSEAAREQPLLLVVDDLQWCDRASVDALFFLGRRLAAEPVAVLLAVRDEAGAADLPGALAGAPGFPEARLSGLDAEGVAEVLAATTGTRPAEPVAAAIAQHTRGNPLAVLEVARLLDRAQLSGGRPLPDVLPVGERLQRAFGDRSAGLTRPGRDLLLLAAAEESGELDPLLAAASPPEPAATVAELEETGLVTVRGGRLAFVHPLARAAVLGDATTQQRVDVHRRLAEVLGVRGEADRALWHRAAATLGPDEELAAVLEALARRSRERSGYAAAASALERAAEHSGTARERTRRLVAAAEEAWLAGQPARVRTLVDRAEPGATEPEDRARILRLRARAATRGGDVRAAHHLFLEAAGLLRDAWPAAALELYAEAVEGAAYVGDLERLAEIVVLASGLPPGTSVRERFLATWLAVGNAGMQGNLARDADLLAEVLELGERLEDPRLLVWAGIAALNLGDVAAMQRFHRRSLELARAAGAVGALPYALEHAAMAQALAGSYAAARSAAEEGLRLAVETEQRRSVSHLLSVLAFIAGALGDEEAGTRYAEQARDISVPLGLGLPTATAAWATAKLDLAAGRYDAAVDRLLTLAGARPDVGHPVITLWSTPDLVESAVRAHREAEVGPALDRLAHLADVGGRPGAAAALSWCRGLLGGPGAEDLLASAGEVFRAVPLPMAEARVRLALGELLRRDRRPREARDHLRVAAQAFRQLGAVPWAERAEAELRASGEAAPTPLPNGLDTLTPQELQIVRFVAQGASNREVAAQLFLSPRTVEYHLYKAYPKLGVSSRTQLVGALMAEPALPGA